MASTNRTEHYMLNNWIGTDQPTRSDFVRDNILIDTALWHHTADPYLHLSDPEKARVSDPYVVQVIQGTDEEYRHITFDFAPKMVICFTIGEAAAEKDGNIMINNLGIAAAGAGSTRGCELNGTSFTMLQRPQGVIVDNLNSSDYQYVIVAFR